MSEENIRLAYRNIKRNSGSHTSGVDRLNIKDIEKMSAEKLVEIIQRKFKYYKPKPVKRVEIPKPNGKTRPLGIPTIVDRLVQQCILQVLEPICEAKFHECSNGFRPNRSAEHALAQCYRMIQVQNLHFVVDVDVKGFFDNVNHADLHAEVRKFIEDHEMTMAEFITLALQDELHPKHNITEVKTMGNMRTLAFQVPEELFQKIKDYLQRNNMTQKDFVIGLIENEIERDLTQRQAMSEAPTDSEEMAEEQTKAQETPAVSDCGGVPEDMEEQLEEQGNTDFSGNFEAENGEYESIDEELEEEQDEFEDMGMTMGM